MERAFVPGVEPPAEWSGSAWWFVFRDGQLLVRDDGGAADLPRTTARDALGMGPMRQHYLGSLAGEACFAAEPDPGADAPAGMSFQPLRALYGRLPDDLFALAGRAVQIVAWDRTHQYCGQCGAKTEYLPGERATVCPDCGLTNYPRLSPAVIVRVTRGDEILLARSPHFATGFYSVLAGFVEAGESLEETVRREVREEVSLEITDLRYFGSQPWPFPNSLMIGFTATYAGGEIQIDAREVADARWFRWDALPDLPGKLSIARRLIDAFVDERSRESAVGSRQ